MKMNMRKLVLSALAPLLLVGCYKDYTLDYDYTAVYVAYQYDLRTFVLGEEGKFDFTVALAGVVTNNKDRNVEVELRDELLSEDLSQYTTTFGVTSFTALDGLRGNGKFGERSQQYVTEGVSGLSELTPLPTEYYTVSGLDNMVIRKGRHTAAVSINATSAIESDANAFKPYYALGFKINKADADSVISEKCFGIIVVKCENKFFGNWYHGGKTVIKNDATGATVSEDTYDLVIPQADSKVYSLTTVDASTVMTDKIGLNSGKLLLKFNGNEITVSSADGSKEIKPISGQPSVYNDAKLLQDRELILNYCYSNGDGTTTYITDYLKFRNRVRDGINEWQDENEKNYE